MAIIRKNDTVTVLTGKDKGKSGKVLKVFTKEHTAIVEGINFVTKHVKPRSQDKQTAGIIKKEAPIILSKVMLMCPRCNRPTKVSYTVNKDQTKSRTCKKCGEVIS